MSSPVAFPVSNLERREVKSLLASFGQSITSLKAELGHEGPLASIDWGSGVNKTASRASTAGAPAVALGSACVVVTGTCERRALAAWLVSHAVVVTAVDQSVGAQPMMGNSSDNVSVFVVRTVPSTVVVPYEVDSTVIVAVDVSHSGGSVGSSMIFPSDPTLIPAIVSGVPQTNVWGSYVNFGHGGKQLPSLHPILHPGGNLKISRGGGPLHKKSFKRYVSVGTST